MSASIHLGKSRRNIPESCQTQIQKDKWSRQVTKMSRETASKKERTYLSSSQEAVPATSPPPVKASLQGPLGGIWQTRSHLPWMTY